MRSVSGYSSTVRVSDRIPQGTFQQKTSQAPCHWTSTSLHPRSNIQLTLRCFSMKTSRSTRENRVIHLKFKVYMTELFLFAFQNIHSVLITTAKSISIASFRSHVLSCKKREISLPVGYKTPQVKTGDWEWLWRHSVSWQADYYARKWCKSAFYMVAITRKTRKKEFLSIRYQFLTI